MTGSIVAIIVLKMAEISFKRVLALLHARSCNNVRIKLRVLPIRPLFGDYY